MMTGDATEEHRVHVAVRRRARTRAFAEAEKAISSVLCNPQVRRVRAQLGAAETQFGQRRAPLQPFQDRYEKAVRDGDLPVLTRICPGKHGRWARVCVLDEGHERSSEDPHWGHNHDGRPIAGVGSAPDDW